jgi:hypothetical protein
VFLLRIGRRCGKGFSGALSVPAARPAAAPVLIVSECRKAHDPGGRGLGWVAGNALSVVADDSVLDEIAALVGDRSYGTYSPKARKAVRKAFTSHKAKASGCGWFGLGCVAHAAGKVASVVGNVTGVTNLVNCVSHPTTRILDEKYGVGNWSKGGSSAASRSSWGTVGFLRPFTATSTPVRSS